MHIKRPGAIQQFKAMDAGLTCNARALHSLLLIAKEQYSEVPWESGLESWMRDPDGLDLDDRVSLREVLITASVIGNRVDDPDLGLKWGETTANTHPDFLGVICSSSPTLGHALFNVTNVLPLIAEVGELCIGSVNGTITLQLVHSDRALVIERFFLDCFLSYLIQVVSSSSMDGVKPSSVGLLYDCPGDETEIHRLLHDEVRYSRPYSSISYASADLVRPMRFPHQGLLHATLSAARRMVEELDDMGKFRRSVGFQVRNLLDKPNPTLEKVSQKLNMSRRTLQRRLDESGLSFREVLRRERHELALTLLENPDQSIADIAYRLGFANQSAFSRAFRQVLGYSPRQYRSRKSNSGGEGD
ncbi:MAG: AraC family transcriptional regulator [Chromatiales bacterium]|nr:AraC family transcriptional regulator [Chromatiales bacterium]